MPAPVDRRHFLASAAGAAGGLARAADLPAKGLVVGHPEAAEAGNAVLAAGGDAVDAVVAAALVAGVAALPSAGIGGYGGALTVGRPDASVASLDFNAPAPAAARPDPFPLDDRGAVRGRADAYGRLAAGVPGVLGGLQLALDRLGTKTFADVVKPAVRYAADGFPVRKGVAAAIRATCPAGGRPRVGEAAPPRRPAADRGGDVPQPGPRGPAPGAG